MASIVSLFVFLHLSSAFTHQHDSSSSSSLAASAPEVLQACKATRFPDTCACSLANSNLPQNPNAFQIVQAAISVSSTNLVKAQSMAKSILDSSTGNPNRTTAAANCLEVLANSQYRLSSAANIAMPLGNTKDARAWMSAALLFQYDCFGALKYYNDTSLTNQTMSFLSTLISFTSNALSMVMSYDIYGNDTKSWGPPKTERDGFWGGSLSVPGGDLGFRGGFPSQLTADVTVCKDGKASNCYGTVQEAVNAAPDNQWGKRFVIHIKEGVYEEIIRVPLGKKNVVFLGDGMGKTVITGSLRAGQPGISTYNTATVGKLVLLCFLFNAD